MILVGETVSKKVYDRFVTHIGISLRRFKTFNAPIVVGRKSIRKIVFRHDFTFGDEGLVAYLAYV